mgnify:CR=1 FL=1
MRRHCFFLSLIAILFIAGCAGARGNLTMSTLEYPVSTSAFLYAEDNKTMLATGKDLTVVKKFEYDKTAWGIMWILAPLSGDSDVAEAINNEIKDSGGDGMTNFTVSVSGCAMQRFNSLFLNFIHIIPILPSCTSLEIGGDIVKQVKAGSVKPRQTSETRAPALTDKPKTQVQ